MEDRERHLTIKGKDIINQFSIILRNAQIHDPDNTAVLNAIERFLSLISPLLETEGKTDVDLIGEYFYLNGALIRVPLERLSNYGALAYGFRKRDLGGISFEKSLSAYDLKILITAYINSSSSDTPFDVMESSLEDTGNIRISRHMHIREDVEYTEKRKMIKRTYFNAVSFTKGIMSKIKAGEGVNMRQAKRVVMSIVDALLEEESVLIGMTSIKDYDEYTYHHCVNVSILAIALGRKIGLSRNDISDLGVMALFHDIGKTGIPVEVLNKPSALTEDEWEIMRRHPVSAVLTALDLSRLDDTIIKIAIAAFEHHIHCNHSGYPSTIYKEKLDFYSRIISIADQYDALTSSRVYSRIPRPPEKALSMMIENSGTQLDTDLLNVFINIVGVYPIGTLVLLDSNDMGIVYETNSTAADRPKLMVIVDNNGERVYGESIDLTERGEGGKYLRTIVKTLDPNKYGISLAEYLL